MPPSRWLLLIHQIPARPNYLRAKVGKLLLRAGGVPLKNSVYVFPNDPNRLEAARAVLDAITEGGGEGVIVEATFTAGLRDADVEEVFRDRVDTACAAAVGTAEAWQRDPPAADERAPLERTYAEQAAADAFGSPVRARLRTLLDRLADPHRGAARPVGRSWVTARRMDPDRLACAWLIQRWIDPAAALWFGDPPLTAQSDAQLFAMPGADLAATADRSAFEAMRSAYGVDAPGLVALGEVVHDATVADERYGRDEVLRVVLFVDTLLASTVSDGERLRRACAFFDGLRADLARDDHP